MRAGGDGAIRRDRDARTIKYETVVAANLIDVDDGNVMLAGESAKHVEPEAALVNRVRGSRDIQKNAGSLPHKLGDGIAFIQALCPEIFVVPGILANGDAELLFVEANDRLRMRGLEITRLVEDVVGGQQHLALLENNAAIGDERGGIGNGLSRVVLSLADIPDN